MLFLLSRSDLSMVDTLLTNIKYSAVELLPISAPWIQLCSIVYSFTPLFASTYIKLIKTDQFSLAIYDNEICGLYEMEGSRNTF